MSNKAFVEMMLAVLLIGILASIPGIETPKLSSLVLQTESSNLIVLNLDFPAPTVTEGVSDSSVMMSGLLQYGAPGEPVLPFRLVRVLVPQGKDVEHVDVTPGVRKALEGRFNVIFGKTPMPISSNVTTDDGPNETIYNSANPFPSSFFSDMSEQYLRGYKLLLFEIYPVQYIPKTGELYYFENMTVTVALQETGEISPLFRNLPQDAALISGVVDNSEAVNTYTGELATTREAAPAAGSSHYDYVLITNKALQSSFQPLVNWKKTEGLNATLVLIEDIMSNPNYNSNGLFGDGSGSPKFNDTQAHVRNFIKDAYMNWGTEYVLLGGDDDIIPARGVYDYAVNYAGNYTDGNIPCDMYYGALDGSWDNNNDSIFGEAVYHWPGPQNATAGEEADFFAEVYVGRAPVDTPQETTNFVTKTIAYEQSTQADYLNRALFVGTTLDKITEGGNGLDTVTDIISQYTTTKLYSRDGTFSSAAVINQMNNGTNIVNDDGHSNTGTVMGLSISDVDSLTNTQYFFVYSMGCYSAAFDEAPSGSQQAIAEHFLFSQHGAFAYIGNSRYGWYCSASVDGPGERYDRSFFSVLNSGTTNLGKALQLSKELEPILDRWTYFDLNLLGDPESQIVTEVKAPTAHFETRTDLLAPPRVGGIVDLRGTAKGSAFGSTFSNYTVDYGLGTAPTFWMTNGISLVNSGASEVFNGTLATWNTKNVALGSYTLRLKVSDAGGLVGEDRWIVEVSPNALPVHIRADGSVDPPTAPVQRSGNVYTLDSNIYSDSIGIVIETDNILLDGAGYTVQGRGGGAAGIYMYGRSHVTIQNITVEAHLYGIYLEQCSDIMIIGSRLTNDTHGISLLGSSNNSIFDSNVTGNYDGISLLSFSNDNSIVGCRVSGNNGDLGSGLYFYMSSNNRIYRNVFADNRMHVYDAAWDCADPGLVFPSINTWDNGYPSGGNYWDDYVGVDKYGGFYQNGTGSDGVGDSAYVIDMNNRDHYPLMLPSILGHDLAVAEIVLLKTVVGQGYCMSISVTIADCGTYDESFNLSLSANSNLITQRTTSLAATGAATMVFIWNTSGFAYGNYTISAHAWPVPSELDISNNNNTGGCVVVAGLGDLTGGTANLLDFVPDGLVNMSDVAVVASFFLQSAPPGPANCDITGPTPGMPDGVIDMMDIGLVAAHFLAHYSYP